MISYLTSVCAQGQVFHMTWQNTALCQQLGAGARAYRPITPVLHEDITPPKFYHSWNRQQAASHIRTAKNSGLWATKTQITCKGSASFNTSAWMASRNLKTPFMDAELMESPNTCRKYNHQLGSLNYNLVQVKVHQHRQTGILNLFCGFPVCRVSGKVCEHLWICSENHAVPKHPGELLHQYPTGHYRYFSGNTKQWFYTNGFKATQRS